jgi:hypothetical protein
MSFHIPLYVLRHTESKYCQSCINQVFADFDKWLAAKEFNENSVNGKNIFIKD